MYRALNLDHLRFQFTLPCRERRANTRYMYSSGEFQFTLPCRERLALEEE